jgi:hypothetical protein
VKGKKEQQVEWKLNYFNYSACLIEDTYPGRMLKMKRQLK